MTRARASRVAAIACVLATGALQAQEDGRTGAGETGRIVGQVLDEETSQPVQSAAVRITDLDLPARLSDGSGWFTLPELPPGIYELEISHLAYGTGTHLVNVPAGETVSLEARLAPDPIAVDELRITIDAYVTRLGRIGFLERERRGWGHFFSGRDLENTPVRQLLVSVPRLEIVQGRSAFDRRITIRSGHHRCVPSIFVDGIQQRWAEGNVENAIAGLRIEAVEVYRGHETPGEFMTLSLHESRPCGAIVIWTRRG